MALLDALPASRMIAVRTNRTQQVGALQSKSHATRRDRSIWRLVRYAGLPVTKCYLESSNRPGSTAFRPM